MSSTANTATTNNKKQQPQQQQPIVSFEATNLNPLKCPFGQTCLEFKLYPGSAVRLAGRSGLGKTTLASHLACLNTKRKLRNQLGIDATVQWNDDIPIQERIGCLFQSTTLIDSLTVAANVCVALDHCPLSVKKQNGNSSSNTTTDTTNSNTTTLMKVKELLEAVGLDYGRDANKKPRELSGGMARRASLALQLAQHKHVIVFDEPFAGLDEKTAKSVALEIRRLRTSRGVAILLICHEEEYAKIVLEGGDGQTITLEEPPIVGDGETHLDSSKKKPNLFGRLSYQRFLLKLFDYTIYSLPLILLTFTATGLAIAMLSSDILRRLDVTDQVISIVEKEIKPLLSMLTGDEESSNNPMVMMMVKMKVRGMMSATMPKAKATLYAIGMAKLFVLEIGPLLTALLLAGRIGGSYAGEVATLTATSQNALLQTLGVHPRIWTLMPSIFAALIASPILTTIGTVLSLYLGGLVGPSYGIGNYDTYVTDVHDTIWPPLRLTNEFRTTMEPSNIYPWYIDSMIELTTYPPMFHMMKACTYILLILVVAETCARWNDNLTPRNVSGVITSSVVISSLTVIVADWGYSQLLLKRQ